MNVSVRRFLLVLFVMQIAVNAAIGRPTPTPCPGVSDISDCAAEGCGSGADPEQNKVKNLRSPDESAATLKSVEWMKELPNPRGSDCRNRDKLRELGEGQKITVVAWALAARKGNPETCNCKLSEPEDTDNHIVLVDPELEHPTLKIDEEHSITAEFTPRVRLDHPNFTQEKLESLIDPTWESGQTAKKGRLLVRVMGQLMFDSEHYCGPFQLSRETDWEIHPVLKMEYCPDGVTCRADSDENWVDLESQ